MIEKLTNGIINQMSKSGFSRVVIGLSGGIDSALSAALAAKALGAESVKAYYLPHSDSNPQSLEDARAVAKYLDITMKVIDITDISNSMLKSVGTVTPLRLGNILSRVRMTILFDMSSKENALVLGTSNKSETLLGYTTWFGDSACSFNPIGDLYKTQVWDLSRELGIPASVINKAPSADHRPGQTDEGDIGYSYAEMDKLLCDYYDHGIQADELIKMGYDKTFVDEIIRRVKVNSFKRALPVVISTK